MRWLALLLGIAGCGRFAFDDRPASGDAASTLDAVTDRPNRIFITSTTSDAALGGTAGADLRCQTAAAGLGGTFVALLSTSTQDAAQRVAGSRGWVDLTGRAIADQPEDFLRGTIHPLAVDELGQPVVDAAAWLGSTTETCSDWTMNPANQSALVVPSNASFATDSYGNCDAVGVRLACAEIGHVAPVAAEVETGRIAFITETGFTTDKGITGADSLCQIEANAAGLSGTFAAYLATSTQTPEQRFSAAGLPWRRADGPRLTDTADELVGPSPIPVWKTFLARTARGTATNLRAWTGTTLANCLDWTSAMSSQIGTLARTHLTTRSELQFQPLACDYVPLQALICLQL